MFNQYEPTVKATIALLKLLNVKVGNATVNETLQNHPDWPSLLCLSDSLNKWGVPNGSGKINISEIGQLPIPFLAYTSNKEFPWAVLSHVDDLVISYYSKDFNKPITVKREKFLKSWDGVYLIAEPNEDSGENDYEGNRRRALLSLFIPASLFILLAIISTIIMYKANLSVGIYVQWLIFIIGTIVTSLLLWYEIDKSNPVLQKVCTGIIKGDCNAILTGKQSKLLSWLSWSEIGSFYFMGSLLALLFLPSSIKILAYLNILALPYTVFSIYYQWRVAKQWCILCLLVQALLVLGSINVIVSKLLTPSIFDVFMFPKTFLCFILPPLVWFTIKPYILLLQVAKNTKREYLRIKFNNEIFETLLKKQKVITVPIDGMGINFGNPIASNTLVKVCSPSCGPCAKAHPEIERLLDECPNLKVKIIFTTPNEPSNYNFKSTQHLMAITANKDDAKIKMALDDWYLAEKKDYEVFAAKYPMNGELQKQGSKLDAMYQWTKTMDIQYTPTIFINGYQLPDAYSIGDLQYFLLE